MRVSKARTKGRTAGQRWLSVPDELLAPGVVSAWSHDPENGRDPG